MMVSIWDSILQSAFPCVNAQYHGASGCVHPAGQEISSTRNLPQSQEQSQSISELMACLAWQHRMIRTRHRLLMP
jgi:hypothetical protein